MKVETSFDTSAYTARQINKGSVCVGDLRDCPLDTVEAVLDGVGSVSPKIKTQQGLINHLRLLEIEFEQDPSTGEIIFPCGRVFGQTPCKTELIAKVSL